MNRLVFIDSLQSSLYIASKLVECLFRDKNDENKEKFPISYFIETNIHLFSNLLEGIKNCTNNK